MFDRYTKIVLTVIAINLTASSVDRLLRLTIPNAWAQETMDVHVVGGQLDYETDVTAGPTLKVCTNC